MFRYFALIYCSLLLSNYLTGQSLSRSIQWLAPVNDRELKAVTPFEDGKIMQGLQSYLRFKNNVDYPLHPVMIPFYSETIPLQGGDVSSMKGLVKIESAEYEPFNENERRLLSNYSLVDISKLKESFSVFKARGKSMLQLSIPAIRVSPVTGEMERLKNFSLSLTHGTTSMPKIRANKDVRSQSVLANGVWKGVKVSQSGVHRITYTELQGMGLTNLDNISLWGHGGKQLPFWNHQLSFDDLLQIPLWVDKGTDGVFGPGDAVYFYAQGPIQWNYSAEDNFFTHTVHDYTDHIHYFVTTSIDNPLRISSLTPLQAQPTRVTSTYDAFTFFERNDTNLIRSGRQWFGEGFDVYTSRTYSANMKFTPATGRAKVRVRAAARSSVSSAFSLKANGVAVGSMSIASVNTASQYTNFASASTETFSFSYTQNDLSLELTYSKPTPSALAWLDYITINARQRLEIGGQQLQFRDIESVGEDVVTEFVLANAASDMVVWDVTNFFGVVGVPIRVEGSVAKFRVETGSLREFVAFVPSQAFGVSLVGDVPNQNIHGQPQPDMVIVTHQNFIAHAQELAQLHSSATGLNVLVVTNQQVYNEFSSGNPDVGAVRNMMRMFYQRATSEESMPKYLLLFGDGSYNNRKQSPPNTGYILTYQSENSLHVTNSFVSDDFFGLLDDDEGEATGLLDIGIGRIPCSTKAEADVAVSKIREYMSPSSVGSWNNQLCFMGDDGDGNMHMRDADLLAQLVEENHPVYNIDKIYFDSYPLVSIAGGNRFPDATDAITTRANQGALTMNYVGHANTKWISNRRVLEVGHIQSWRNLNKLSLFITATCEFSRFDDFFNKSIGEHALFSPTGGSVALVSTSRVVYANPNYTLNRNFVSFLFTKNPSNGAYYALGDLIRLAKVATGGQINKRNFMLLGDPALTLKYPKVDVALTHINGKEIPGSLDTLRALSRVSVEGLVANTKQLNFFGEAEVTLYDKAKEVSTLANTGGEPFKYNARQSNVYKGRSSVTNGVFASNFIIPKDIMYSYGGGRFSLFASNGEVGGAGYFEDFIVGGINPSSIEDLEGPEVSIFMNSREFVSGGITDQNPKLLVQLMDSSGINTTGAGIGHDLSATIVGEKETRIILNDFYQAELDSYQKGKVEYQLLDLQAGNYKVKVKAWDVYNNSSEAEIEFKVVSDEKLKLSHVLNYPNPFTSSTGFYFEHNRPYEDFSVSIQIFSPSGKLVRTLEQPFTGDGRLRVGPITWDGLDDFGDRIGRGVYFYKLRVQLPNGTTEQAFQKLVILK